MDGSVLYFHLLNRAPLAWRHHIRWQSDGHAPVAEKEYDKKRKAEAAYTSCHRSTSCCPVETHKAGRGSSGHKEPRGPLGGASRALGGRFRGFLDWLLAGKVSLCISGNMGWALGTRLSQEGWGMGSGENLGLMGLSRSLLLSPS